MVPFFRFRHFYAYERCWETSLVISNMLTVAFPPNTAFKASSALILRLLFGSCRLCFLMYTHSAFTTSDRGIGPCPTITASSSLTCMGFMNAAFDFAIVLVSYYDCLSIADIGS